MCPYDSTVLVLLAVAVAAEQKREAEPHYGHAGHYATLTVLMAMATASLEVMCKFSVYITSYDKLTYEGKRITEHSFPYDTPIHLESSRRENMDDCSWTNGGEDTGVVGGVRWYISRVHPSFATPHPEASAMKFLVLVLLAAAVAAEQKREAEPHYGYAGHYVHPYRAYGYGYAVPGGHVQVHAVGKREAEPEAEPHYYGGHYGGYGYPYGHLYAPHAHSYVHTHGIGKREAEAEPEPHTEAMAMAFTDPMVLASTVHLATAFPTFWLWILRVNHFRHIPNIEKKIKTCIDSALISKSMNNEYHVINNNEIHVENLNIRTPS
nr:uncharacterized protein LOC113830482 [Penaeus vannamei]